LLGLTVVVSPLISLMEDQIKSLKELNISTAIINAQTSREESNRILKSMEDQKSDLRIVYVTPKSWPNLNHLWLKWKSLIETKFSNVLLSTK
jgi:superfamily II DNA helicase RecQ